MPLDEVPSPALPVIVPEHLAFQSSVLAFAASSIHWIAEHAGRPADRDAGHIYIQHPEGQSESQVNAVT